MVVNGHDRLVMLEYYSERTRQLNKRGMKPGHGMLGEMFHRRFVVALLFGNRPDFVSLGQGMIHGAPGIAGFRSRPWTTRISGKKYLHGALSETRLWSLFY